MFYNTAEIIPEEPDADNAAVGRIYTRFAVWFFCCAYNFWRKRQFLSVPERNVYEKNQYGKNYS